MLRAGARIGPYTLLHKLGSGTFGTVWLAEKITPVVSTRVAVKIPLEFDGSLAALKQEAMLRARAAGHPNVLPIIDADIYDDTVVIVSEYAPSGSLGDWLTKNGGSSPTVGGAVAMVDGILAGLGHLHGQDSWFFAPKRTHNFAETFFKIHIFHEGNGYLHLLAAANPERTVWLETATGFRKEATLCWSGDPAIERTDLWMFNWR